MVYIIRIGLTPTIERLKQYNKTQQLNTNNYLKTIAKYHATNSNICQQQSSSNSLKESLASLLCRSHYMKQPFPCLPMTETTV